LKPGNEEFGYGCGLAEIDELYSSTMMSEILHNTGYKTERMLVVIEHPGGYGIGVRAGANLFRPAHLFMHLKQGNYSALKRATDFVIQRQVDNGEWDINPKSTKKYNYMLDALTDEFAEFTAHLERDYIFAWLDWDGDNVLVNAGIIDYGSIRQFGVRHDQYRYDDIERYSTNLNEQKGKAKLMVQVFCQLTDYLNHKERRPLKEFSNHPMIKKFEEAYEYYILERFLFQLGLDKKLRKKLLLKRRSTIENLYQTFYKLETLKTHQPKYFVEDGINRPPRLNMRKFITLIASDFLLNQKINKTTEELYHECLIEEHFDKDREISYHLKNNIEEFIINYKGLMSFLIKDKENDLKIVNKKQTLNRIKMINSPKRITGNALVFIVNELLEKKQKNYQQKEIQDIMEKFIVDQSLNPEGHRPRRPPKASSNKTKSLMRTVLSILDEHSEDI
jgi:hypothetical protein